MSKRKGFTLIELMVTVAILSILMMIAAPSYRTMMQRGEAGEVLNRLRSSLELAQSEAMRLNRRVVVCASNNGTACNGNWNEGWIVGFRQGSSDAIHLIRDFPPADSAININYSNSSTNPIFYGDGRLPPGNSGGTFTAISTDNNQVALCLDISATGRIRTGNWDAAKRKCDN